jgi:hypothetical protein
MGWLEKALKRRYAGIILIIIVASKDDIRAREDS